MNVPHTWLSTEFRGGRRALRRRLRGIFSAPRRWGALPLACALLVTALAGGLASCGESPTAPTLEAGAASLPELDLEGLLIRYPGEEDWTDLAALIPAPAAWAGQSQGGRNEIDRLDHDIFSFDPGIQGAFVDPQNGWLTFSYPMGLGPISDTCVYRTHDGGRTWEEAGALEGTGGGTGPLWFSLNCAAFLDDDRAVLCTGLFLGAPVFYTADGGAAWAPAELPEVSDGWQAESISFSGADGLILSRAGEPAALISHDFGASWEALELPWPASLPEGEPFRLDPALWEGSPLAMVGISLDRTAALFAFDQDTCGIPGTLLSAGGVLSYFPGLSFHRLPQMLPAQLQWGDYDQDGAQELAVLTCEGTGTGVSLWDLWIFEPAERGLRLSAQLQGSELWGMDLEDIAPGLVPASGGIGPHCVFQMDGGGLQVQLGVLQPESVQFYQGELTCAVLYDGAGLSLSDPAYAPYPD